MSRAAPDRTRHERSQPGRGQLWWQVYRERIRAGLEYCRECGYVGTDLTFDHLVPVADGGRLTFDNVTILGRPDNVRKGSDRWPHLRSLQHEEGLAVPERQWVRLAREQRKAEADAANQARQQLSPERAALMPVIEMLLAQRRPDAVHWQEIARLLGYGPGDDSKDVMGALRALHRRGVVEPVEYEWRLAVPPDAAHDRAQ